MRRGIRIRSALAMAGVLVAAVLPVAATTADAAGTNQISLTPSPLDFGRVGVGTTTTRTLTITNDGTATWTMATFGAPLGAFGQNGGTCWTTPIASGQHCTLNVTFSPSVLGPASAQIVLYNSLSEVTWVNMTGLGVLAGVHAALSPATMQFGNVPLGSSSDVLMTITNTGDQTFTVGPQRMGQLTISDPSYNCYDPVAPGASCTILWRFTPTVVGPMSDLITIFAADLTVLGSVNVTGAGVVARPVITGLSPTGGPATGGTRVTITGINFSGATAVTFGTKRATKVSCTATRCVVTSPAGTGKVLVKVTTPKGTSRAVSTAYFTYR